MKQQLFELKSRMAARRRSNSSSTFERRASKLWFPFLSPEFHSTKCRSLRVTEENSPFCLLQRFWQRGSSSIWTRTNRIWRRDISWGIAFGFGLRRVFPAEMILNLLRRQGYEALLKQLGWFCNQYFLSFALPPDPTQYTYDVGAQKASRAAYWEPIIRLCSGGSLMRGALPHCSQFLSLRLTTPYRILDGTNNRIALQGVLG